MDLSNLSDFYPIWNDVEAIGDDCNSESQSQANSASQSQCISASGQTDQTNQPQTQTQSVHGMSTLMMGAENNNGFNTTPNNQMATNNPTDLRTLEDSNNSGGMMYGPAVPGSHTVPNNNQTNTGFSSLSQQTGHNTNHQAAPQVNQTGGLLAIPPATPTPSNNPSSAVGNQIFATQQQQIIQHQPQQMLMPPQAQMNGFPIPFVQHINPLGLLSYQHQLQGLPQSIQFVNHLNAGSNNGQVNSQVMLTTPAIAPPVVGSNNDQTQTRPQTHLQHGLVSGQRSTPQELHINFAKAANSLQASDRVQSAGSNKQSATYASAYPPIQQQMQIPSQGPSVHSQGNGNMSMSPFCSTPLGYAVMPGPVDLNPISAQNLNASLSPSPYHQMSNYTQFNLMGQPITNSLPVSSAAPTMSVTQDSEGAFDANEDEVLGETAEQRTRQLRERNNREQKRAQKISELIDSLRSSMMDGGWKVEVKSKSHTLEQTKTYIEYLQNLNRENEEKVMEARKKLEQIQVRVRERESGKAQSDTGGGSEPESVMSSLTGDSTTSDRRNTIKRGSKDTSSSQETSKNTVMTCKSPAKDKHTMSPSCADQERYTDDKPQTKLSNGNRSSSREDGVVENATEHGKECTTDHKKGSDCPEKRPDNIQTNNRPMSRMSDVTSTKGGETDSNIAIAPGTNSNSDICAGGTIAEGRSREDTTQVVPEIQVVKRKRSSRGHKKTSSQAKYSAYADESSEDNLSSLDPEFKLNYRDVFLMSNVPQLISTVTGGIIAWNHFFTAMTGLRSREVRRMTIFSVVQVEYLSNLFELVAVALKGSKERSPDGARKVARKSNKSRMGGSIGTNNSNGEVSGITSASNCGNSTGGSSGEASTDKTEGGSSGKSGTVQMVNKDEAKASRNEESKPRVDFKSVTLPCISFEDFRAAENRKDDSKNREFSGLATGQVYMTVTLLDDPDARKRCFHCAITNSPARKESVGPISQDLLRRMFSCKKKEDNKSASKPPISGENKKRDNLCVSQDSSSLAIDVKRQKTES